MARNKTNKRGRKKKVESKLSEKQTEQIQKNENDIAEETNNRLEKFRRHQLKLKYWMWLGVFGFSAIILFFWGWSLLKNISLISWEKTQEQALVKKTQDEWNKIFIENAKQEAEKKQIKNKLKNLIEELEKQAERESSTTTIAEPTSTVTTTFSTSTTSTIVK